jgi:leader peptidase (prepilin peptidase) / N-methyltransferase
VEAFLVVAATLAGLVLGSFANVPIHRWPAGGTVTEPKRSSCPSCGTQIRAVDNIPVFSWILLKGRCRECDAAISPRYLVVEVITGVLFGAVAWVWGFDPLLPALLVLTWSLVVATAIDLEHRIIPNRLTFRLPVILLPLLVFAAAVDRAWPDLLRGTIAAVAVPGVMLALSELFRLLRGQPGIGMGDIKLAISLGLVIGYLGGFELVVFAYATIISAVVIAIVLLVAGKAKLASRIPFGPYLAVGAMVVILAQEPTTRFVARLLGM